MKKVRYYFDYKSPYAYLAQASAWALADEPGVEVEFLPYTLQIPKYLGDAKLNETGEDTIGTRNDHQWRRVKYSYMDCRREANRRGLTIRGPRKIFDSSLSHIAFLFVRGRGEWRKLHDTIFKQFWRRELDIENLDVMKALMQAHGFDTGDFDSYLESAGAELYAEVLADAEARGVFGVPSYLVGDELFWGQERLPRVRELLGLP